MTEETPAGSRARTPATLAFLAMIAIVAAAFFASGYATCRVLEEDRVRGRADARFREFLTIGTDMGFVTIDRQKVAELECVMSEAEWEDREAEERGQGGEK